MSVLRACGAISTRFVPCLPRYSKRERGRGGRTLISFDLVAPLRRSDTRNFPSFVLGRTSTVYLSTLSSLLALTLPPACSPDRFVTTTGSAYKGHTFRRRNSHPALDARENNPQSTSHFKFERLPSGQSIAVRVVPGVDGMTSGLGEGPPGTGQATTRSVYTGRAHEPWMRGNTARYGNASRDWARKAVHQQGIAPVVSVHDIQSLTTSRSVTKDAYHREGPSTKNKNLSDVDAQHITRMFQPEFAPHVMEWVKMSSPWAAEVLLDMLHEVASTAKKAETEASEQEGAGSDGGVKGSPVKLPDLLHTL